MADHTFTEEEALLFHSSPRPGKLEIVATKPMATQLDLSLAYSPGVAVPVEAIAEDPSLVYDFTSKGNIVAVISNGTAILGLGNLGPLASKPVMEGKAVLFKRFGDVDSIDLEVDTSDIDEFVNCVRFLGPSFGGINLEDIKAPECFIIEQRLREVMDIPVFHDDQHGTAIISAAGLINAADLTGKRIEDMNIVINGAGAAGIACLELIKSLGLPHDQGILCDTKGVIYQGREEGMNQWKSAHAVDTDKRTLADVMVGADVFLGLSVKDAVTDEMVMSMADQPVIFAMANPDPEISPERVHELRDDAIVATGRSDYPNQVNNLLGFPYIFRGALDVRATTVNDEMKLAAAHALASLAREDVPDEVAAAYSGERLQYGPNYIIPVPFDPRLITAIPSAVAQAAMDSGVARRPIIDMDSYKKELRARLDPTAGSLQLIFDRVIAAPKRVVFAEGEEDKIIRAAVAFRKNGYGDPVLIGRPDVVLEMMLDAGIDPSETLEVIDIRESGDSERYAEHLYDQLQRDGYLLRDCQRMVNNDRNVYAACMVAVGEADALITGITRSYPVAMNDIRLVIPPREGQVVFGISIVVSRGRTVFLSDTSAMEEPTSEQLADVAQQSADIAREFGHEPRLAFLSYSNFGNPDTQSASRVHRAVEILDERRPDFVYEGEMAANVALNPEVAKLFPFSRIAGDANVLIMPNRDAANISSELLQEMAGSSVIGPLLTGMSKPVQILRLGSSVSDVVAMAALAAYSATQ